MHRAEEHFVVEFPRDQVENLDRFDRDPDRSSRPRSRRSRVAVSSVVIIGESPEMEVAVADSSDAAEQCGHCRRRRRRAGSFLQTVRAAENTQREGGGAKY